VFPGPQSDWQPSESHGSKVVAWIVGLLLIAAVVVVPIWFVGHYS
jgi:hypothetical protein